MIQIERLRVKEFRGIREIELDLGGKSFIIHGPNGSGKSGIVDAIDFALTGNVRRLSGEGTGTVSITNHAPHVLARSTPTNAVVELTVKDIASGKSAVLVRNVASPRDFTLTPNTPEVRAALSQAGSHPEITLSRREVIKLIVSTAAKRSEGIQALLQLDHLGAFRQRLQHARNKADQTKSAAQTNLTSSERSLVTHVGGTAFDEAVLLKAVNERRRVLGAPDLTVVNGETDFLAAVTLEASQSGISLATAITETDTLITMVADVSGLDSLRETVFETIVALGEKPGLREAISRQELLTVGLEAVASQACPLCGQEWPDMAALQEHIQAEIDRGTEAHEQLEAATIAATEYGSALQSLKQAVDKVIAPARVHGAIGLAAKLEAWSTAISQHAGVLDSDSTIIAAVEQFTVRKYDAPVGVTDDINTLATTLKALPDLSAAMAARDFLSVAKERWGNVIANRHALANATTGAELAVKVYKAYASAVDHALNSLYQTVEQDFSQYYQLINSDDEASFRAQFTPSGGSLELAVDFYGIDMFPPNAYHSEGHQDGMGVCLYLALMKQLLGKDFRLSILDDVVMSVDINHRRQFCELLKSEFPRVQFIITTHDEVWARQMQSAGFVSSKQQARFYGWSVDGGPLFEQSDTWERIDAELARGEVNSAAHKLRLHLEAAAADIAEAIGGRVAYRGDADYALGELMSAVSGALRELLRKAADSANSWNNEAAKQDVKRKKEAAGIAIPEQQVESWPINKLVHQNDWAQMSAADFRPVLDAAKQYLGLFICDNDNCHGWIHIEGRPSPASLRCDCGSYNLNLTRKS